MELRFKEEVEKTEGGERRFTQERVEVANGDYRRVFEAKEEPFEVTSDEWPMLKRTGLFEVIEEATPEQRQEGQRSEQQEGLQQTEQGDASGAVVRRPRQRAADK
ncbi:MAG TPA: hypothetical protein VF659_09430 [Pyrinomonadaceae bacterium]|jgi:hypothetical protein